MNASAVALSSGALSRHLTRCRRDPLVRNSLYLLAATTLVAAFGFLFWIVVARMYPAESVGHATSVLSALNLLTYFSLFGLNNTIVQQLGAGGGQQREKVTSSLTAVSAAGLTLALGFVLLLPVVAPDLAFLGVLGNALVFIALAAFATLNLVTDSVFVALRAARYNLFINGLLMGSVKLALPIALVSLGAMGIVISNGLASAVAAVCSVLGIRYGLRLSGSFRLSPGWLRSTVRFSAATYVSGCLNLLPQLVIPLVVLRELGAVSAAVYFVAFQIANLLNSASYAVGEALFAEGAHVDDFRSLVVRSGATTAALVGPAVAVTVALGHLLLTFFGPEYVEKAHGPLVVLALSAPAVALNVWLGFLLKIRKQLVWLPAANLTFAAVTIGLVVIAAPHGLVWVAAAWGVGNLVHGLVEAVALSVRGHPAADPAQGCSGLVGLCPASPSGSPPADGDNDKPRRRRRSLHSTEEASAQPADLDVVRRVARRERCVQEPSGPAHVAGQGSRPGLGRGAARRG